MPTDPASCATTDLDAIERSFPHNKKVTEQYVDKETLEYVRSLVPNNVVENKDSALVTTLMRWFKNDFMQWLPNQMKCANCSTSGSDGGPIMQQTIQPGSTWQLRKTEVFKCANCGAQKVYPRYSDVKKIADTRLGRCGEWSILFGAVLNSVSVQARIVHDYLDHCWNEALINGRWVHIDSTLQFPASLDNPYLYERNWGKKYTYVLAFDARRVQDVTGRYTEQWDAVLQRRKQFVSDAKNVVLSLADSASGPQRMSEENLQSLYSSVQ